MKMRERKSPTSRHVRGKVARAKKKFLKRIKSNGSRKESSSRSQSFATPSRILTCNDGYRSDTSGGDRTRSKLISYDRNLISWSGIIFPQPYRGLLAVGSKIVRDDSWYFFMGSSYLDLRLSCSFRPLQDVYPPSLHSTFSKVWPALGHTLRCKWMCCWRNSNETWTPTRE